MVQDKYCKTQKPSEPFKYKCLLNKELYFIAFEIFTLLSPFNIYSGSHYNLEKTDTILHLVPFHC